jgi:hypothetical protein
MKEPQKPLGQGLAQALSAMSNEELFFLRAALEVEMRQRKLAFSVGEYGERLAIEYFRRTPGMPKLQPAPRGTKNVDALSRNGDRYSIKAICNAKKTGTIYPDPEDKNKQLFEYLLIVRMKEDWSLQSIHQIPWAKFLEIRSWDKRMSAWYVGCSEKNLTAATAIYAAATPRNDTDELPLPANTRGPTTIHSPPPTPAQT